MASKQKLVWHPEADFEPWS